jgi:NADPH:quinone reductase-like Zn-dependent oxidoreductase
MIIRLGRHDGFKTLNLVRRPEAIDELKALGADAVVCSTQGPIEEQVRSLTGGEGVHYALDCVGGETGTGVFNSLGSDSRMLVYGTLSASPLEIDPRRMIAGKRVVEGFWLGHWMRSRSKVASLNLFREIARLIHADVLATTTGPEFPLDAITEAVRHAEQVGRQGKVLLRIAPA